MTTVGGSGPEESTVSPRADPAMAVDAEAVDACPRAEPGRIATMLRAIAEIGADGEGAVSRLAFTPAERKAHDLVAGWLRDLGLAVRQDAIGNTIAERRGRRTDLPAIAVGSHLDSVPRGGRFDGIVGVVGAVELVRLLAEREAEIDHPVRVVCFAGEEGARFGEPCIGSKAVTGMLERRDLRLMHDMEGVSLAAALSGVGLDPAKVSEARWEPAEWAAFLELHVEQGRVLEAAGRHIGLVDVVSGSTRLRLTVNGRADHSGGTPMGLRADALAAAAEIILAAEALASDERHRGTRTTVGYLSVHPNSITTIPGRVTLTVDVRDIDTDRQRQAAAEVVAQARQICERRATSLEASVIADTSPAVLPIWIRGFTSAACADLGIEYLVLTSGASHDAQVVNRRVPAGMIFVPSRDGLSHVPEEWTSSADIARGVDVLTESVLRLDRFLGSVASLGDESGSEIAR